MDGFIQGGEVSLRLKYPHPAQTGVSSWEVPPELRVTHLGSAASAQVELQPAEDMDENNRTLESWHQSLQAVLNALNQTLHGAIPCSGEASAGVAGATRGGHAGRNANAYMYILFVMTLFAATVGSLILGYTRSRKVDKRSDPYHIYIKNRVSMI